MPRTRCLAPANPPLDPDGFRYGVQSRVIKCAGRGVDKNRCVIDWDAPDEYDEISDDVSQCVVFVCGRYGEYVLCSTWRREATR